jgi:hypothetical protein
VKKNFYSFLFAIFLAQFVTAQAPGGVASTLTMWVQPSGISQSSNLITAWTYANDGTKSFAPGPSLNPNYVANAINYLSAANFTRTQYMSGPTGTNAPITAGNPSYTAFVVWQSNINNDYQRLWSQRSNCGNCNDAFAISSWNNGDYGDETGTPPYLFGMPQPYTIPTWHVSEIQLLNQSLSDLVITDETNFAGAPTVANTDPAGVCGPCLRSIANSFNLIGLNFDGTEGLGGSIAEIIVYNGPLSSTQSENVFSYLSLKYGISLGGTLISSAGTTIWDASANSAYNNQVFGLGTDNSSGLSITQANNSITGVGDGSGQSGAGNVILSLASPAADQSFLFVGNNAGSLTESTTGAPATPAGLNIFGRTWKTQNTNSTGPVNVSIDYTGLAHDGTLGDATTFRMLVDPTGAGDFSTAPTLYMPTSFSGSSNAVVNYSGVSLPTGAAFTFGSSVTPLPVTWTAFTANVVNQTDIALAWTIANNQNAKNYVVEHSLDGANFSAVGTVDNIANVQSYSYLYTGATPGNHYFRVHETDVDGQNIYSTIVSAVIKFGDLSLRLISNPIQGDQVDMELTTKTATQVYVSVLSTNGSRIMTQVQTLQSGANRSQLLLNNLAAGNYILEVRTGTTTLHQTFLKL